MNTAQHPAFLRTLKTSDPGQSYTSHNCKNYTCETETSEEKMVVAEEAQIEEKALDEFRSEDEYETKDGSQNILVLHQSLLHKNEVSIGEEENSNFRDESYSEYTFAKLGSAQKKLDSLSIDIINEQVEVKRDITYSGVAFSNFCNQWKEQYMYIWNQMLCIGIEKIALSEITKLKCLKEGIDNGCLKIKIVQNHSRSYFISAPCQSLLGFPKKNQHFTWFLKLIHAKIQPAKARKTRQSVPLAPDRSASAEQAKNALVCGTIYKKSQHLSNWQQRRIIITSSELASYKPSSDCPSFCIKSSQVKYIWTRYDLHNEHLIIKIKHGLMKTQFAVPTSAAMDAWIGGFYGLMRGTPVPADQYSTE